MNAFHRVRCGRFCGLYVTIAGLNPFSPNRVLCVSIGVPLYRFYTTRKNLGAA